MVDAASFVASTQARYRSIYFLLLAALTACGLWVALIEGPAMHASALERLDREITAENLGFCEKFGMRSGTSEFLACTSELAIVRQKQTERDQAAEFGIF